MQTLSENAKKFLARRPFRLGTIQGYRFFEDPTHGDEGYLWAITPAGKLKNTREIEFDIDDLTYWIDNQQEFRK